MRITCERCSTTYELDPARLSPAGTPVQCTRCRHVFRAFPPVDGRPALPLEPESEAPGPSGPGGPPADARGVQAGPGDVERTAQYPAPAPSPGRAGWPVRPVVPRGRAEPARPRAREGRSRTWVGLLVVVLVLGFAAAAWMALRGR